MEKMQSVSKKKLKDYLLEGLMIFVAVTLGFFAESIRENMNDRKKEREYVASLMSNLEQDTAQFKSVISDNRIKMAGLDRLLSLRSGTMDADAKRLLYQAAGPYVSGAFIFRSNDATMVQLKNSGGLPFIRRSHIADSIVYYDLVVRAIYAAEIAYQESIKDAVDEMSNVLIFRVHQDTSYYKDGKYTSKELPLLTGNPRELEVLFNKVSDSRGWTFNYLDKLERFYPYSVRLLQLLKNEYGSRPIED
jgi:hypothetical protein